MGTFCQFPTAFPSYFPHSIIFPHTFVIQLGFQVKAKKKDGEDDEYESDFIDDDEMDEPIDVTDEDENWAPNDTDTD